MNQKPLKATAASMWGASSTEYFFALTPERILAAVEELGVRCTGRCLALNSLENRVFEVELEVAEEGDRSHPSRRFVVVKFYRPGRWNEAQIAEEHAFLSELHAQEIPVVAPLKFANGATLKFLNDVGCWYAVFPKAGGRIPEELQLDHAARVGRLVARMHNVGAARPAQERLLLCAETYARANREFLIEADLLPRELRQSYAETTEALARIAEQRLCDIPVQRIHGDLHLGNLLWGSEGPRVVDFDDMVRGPVVQDLWLILPGADSDGIAVRESFIEGYEQMRPFPRLQLEVIEVLRSLRLIHFTAWIARRWEDPAFPRAFPAFSTERYWQEHVQDLREQLRLVETPTRMLL